MEACVFDSMRRTETQKPVMDHSHTRPICPPLRRSEVINYLSDPSLNMEKHVIPHEFTLHATERG